MFLIKKKLHNLTQNIHSEERFIIVKIAICLLMYICLVLVQVTEC